LMAFGLHRGSESAEVAGEGKFWSTNLLDQTT
jgi:hypothetical protein